jgi:crotonobetainyl-CoA:carnitine CoA-transferase CaiB-like acyl-CoA transferase
MDRIVQHLGKDIDEISQEMMEEMVSKLNRDEAVEQFTSWGLPCAPIYHVDEAIDDLHVKARDMFVELEHPLAGKIKLINFPLKFSKTQPKLMTPAPTLGQHNKEIIMDLIGYDEEKYNDLMKKGVISYSDK